MANFTKAQMFTAIADAIQANSISLVINDNEIASDEIAGFLSHEIELLTKRASHKTPTKNQKENESIKEVIIATLENASDDGLSISDMLLNDTLSGYKSQKISALLTQLRKEGKVRRFYVKKTPYFAIGDETAETADSAEVAEE